MQADSSQTTQAVCATRATRTFGIIGTTRPKQAPYGTLETHQQRPIMFIMFGFIPVFRWVFVVLCVLRFRVRGFCNSSAYAAYFT